MHCCCGCCHCLQTWESEFVACVWPKQWRWWWWWTLHLQHRVSITQSNLSLFRPSHFFLPLIENPLKNCFSEDFKQFLNFFRLSFFPYVYIEPNFSSHRISAAKKWNYENWKSKKQSNNRVWHEYVLVFVSSIATTIDEWFFSFMPSLQFIARRCLAAIITQKK